MMLGKGGGLQGSMQIVLYHPLQNFGLINGIGPIAPFLNLDLDFYTFLMPSILNVPNSGCILQSWGWNPGSDRPNRVAR